MKRALYSFLIIVLSAYYVAGQVFIAKSIAVRFFSEATIENIDATNMRVSSLLDTSTKQLVFQIPITAFEFDKDLMKESLKDEVTNVLSSLTEREAEVIKLYFGIDGDHSATLEEIGERFNLTRERVRQIKEKALRNLRHSKRSYKLKAYLG